MTKLTDFSMRNVAAMLILILLLTFGGIYAGSSLKMEMMPDISFPVVVVATNYQAPPKDVAEDVTKPLEKALSGLEGLKNMTSVSSDNYSQIILELESNKKPEDVKPDVEDLIANVKLPQRAERPKVMTFGFASQPSYYMAVYGKEGMTQAELNRIVKDVIEPAFSSIPGYDHMDTVGNQEATIDVKLDAGAINNYGLSPEGVSAQISAALTSSPAGVVDLNGTTQMVRVQSDLDTVYNLENLEIATPRGDVLLLKQIAKVEAINEAKFFTRLNGRPAVALHVYKTKAGNIVEFGDRIDALIEGWKTTQPDISFDKVFNATDLVKESINGMLREGLLGALLASVMILLFLKNVRMTLIVLVSIPLSLLIALLIMRSLDITLNIMTLGGLAIAVGRVVDDSIVVIENIYSHLKKTEARNESVIKYATKQVASAITSSTITTVGVFIPLGMVTGVIGEIFKPFALTLVSALLASLVVAVTVIPMLAKLLVLRSGTIRHEEPKIGRILGMYRRTLQWSLRHRFVCLALAGTVFLATLVLSALFLPTAFMPASDSDRSMQFDIKLPNGTSMDATDLVAGNLETKLREMKDADGKPVFKFVETMVGYYYDDQQYSNRAMYFAEVNKSKKLDPTKVKDEVKRMFEQEVPKGSTVNAMLLSYGGDASNSTFSYSLKGDDALLLKQGAELIKEKMKEFPELTDVKDSLGDTKMEVEIAVDQSKLRRYGLTAGQLTQMVYSWLGKQDLGERRFGNETFKTTVQLDPLFKDSVDRIGQLMLRTPTGELVHLNEIAAVRQIEAPASIYRENQIQYVTVSAKIESKNTGGVSAKVSAALNAIELPSGISREVTGVSDDIQEGFQQLFVAMGASVLIVYFVMVLTFGNAGAPFAILFSLPLAAIGGLLGLFITRLTLDMTSMIGFLMLIGIVVTNAIVLVDRVQQLREEGLSTREALVEAGTVRMRPIIMTAGATIFALLPLALGLSEGALISQGLAVVVIGGLITSTLLTLIIVPIAYDVIDRFKERVARRIHRQPKTAKEFVVQTAEKNLSTE